VRDRYPDAIYGIPTAGAVRSLNLASAAAIIVYEALRAVGALGGSYLEDAPVDAHPEPDEFVR
jgi:tRNA (cytidine/uridine-2'-O-)-methyltransferase